MIPVRIKQLPIEELEHVIAGRRFTGQSRAILTDVLVRGLPQSEVAKQYQVSRGRVNRLLGAFSEIYARKPGRRMGMVTISMEMPEALAKGMESAMRSYKSCGVDRRKYDALNLMLGAAAEAQAILEPKSS